MSRNGRRQGLMADLVRRGSSSPQKNRPLAAQLLLCKVLGALQKSELAGRPPGLVILKLKYHHCRAYHLGINYKNYKTLLRLYYYYWKQPELF